MASPTCWSYVLEQQGGRKGHGGCVNTGWSHDPFALARVWHGLSLSGAGAFLGLARGVQATSIKRHGPLR